MNTHLPTLSIRAIASQLRIVLLGSLTMASVASATAAEADQQNPGSANADLSVSIAAFAFAPVEISIPVGSTLTWTNAQDGVQHTTTSVDGVWDSAALSTNQAFVFAFNQTGDFSYLCEIHPTMRGIVHVVADASGQGTTDTTNTDATIADATGDQGNTAAPAGADPTGAPSAAPSLPRLLPTAAPQVPTPAPSAASGPIIPPTPTPRAATAPRTSTPTPVPYYGY